MQISNLVAAERAFRKHLRAVRETRRDIGWYPYDSLANLPHLGVLLPGSTDIVPDRGSVLDVGCADGDVGFLFASLGCDVEFLDNPTTNFNACKGVRGTANLLGHAGRVLERDID